MTTTRYWHIAHQSYTDGDDLTCRNQLSQEGHAPKWGWDEADEGFDGDVVCLFDDRDGRRDADWLWSDRPDGVLLAIDVPDETEIAHVEQGYPAIVGRVPAEWITTIRRGYATGAIA